MKEPFIIDARYQNLKGEDKLREYERDKLLYEQAKQLEKLNSKEKSESDIVDELMAEINYEKSLKLKEQKMILDNASQEKKNEYISKMEKLESINRCVRSAYDEANRKSNLLYESMRSKIEPLNNARNNINLKVYKDVGFTWFGLLMLVGLIWMSLKFGATMFKDNNIITIIAVSILVGYPLIAFIHNNRIKGISNGYYKQIKKLFVDIHDVPMFKIINYVQDLGDIDNYERKASKYIDITISDYIKKLDNLYERNKKTTFSLIDKEEYYKIED